MIKYNNIKFVLSAFIVFFLVYGCGSSKLNTLSILRMNKQEFDEINKISVEDEKGFKYIKISLGNNKFKEISTTTVNQSLTKEDERKIKDILKKY